MLLDAPLPDHDWSEEVSTYAEEGERLMEAGDLDAVTELDLGLLGPEHGGPAAPDGALGGGARYRRRSRRWTSSAVSAPTLVAVGEQDKADFHAIADRLVRELPERRARRDPERRPPSLDGASRRPPQPS